MNIVKFLRTPILKKICKRLVLSAEFRNGLERKQLSKQSLEDSGIAEWMFSENLKNNSQQFRSEDGIMQLQ